MEKAEARKLQPYFIRAFFNEAFQKLGGELRPREPGRYEIRHVPATLRERDRIIGETRTPVLPRYERICFEKHLIRADGKPMASLIHPGHPLMQAATDLILEAHRHKLKQGAVLVDPNDDRTEPRLLFMIDHSVREGSGDPPKTVSRRLQFVELDAGGQATHAGWAPHLDLQPIDPADLAHIGDVLDAPWITDNLEAMALAHASGTLVPEHFREIKDRRERQVDKILGAVKERLVKEINYQSGRAIKLEMDVKAGKQPRFAPEQFKRRAEELSARLEQRIKELENKRHVISSTPVIVGGALIIPHGLLAQRNGETTFCADADCRSRIEQIAMRAVIDAEAAMGREVIDVSSQKCGWDITARPPMTDGKLPEDRHIEVKGRAKGQSTITVSRNEVMYGLNQKEKFLLAIVLVDADDYEGPFYVREPLTQEPDWAVSSVNLDLETLLARSTRCHERNA